MTDKELLENWKEGRFAYLTAWWCKARGGKNDQAVLDIYTKLENHVESLLQAATASERARVIGILEKGVSCLCSMVPCSVYCSKQIAINKIKDDETSP